MLIEQINELEFRRPEPDRTCTPITAYFNDKTKISQKNLRDLKDLNLLNGSEHVQNVIQWH